MCYLCLKLLDLIMRFYTTFLLAIFLLFNLQKLHAQTYQEFIEEALTFYQEKKYNQAVEKYNNASAVDLLSRTDAYNLSCCYSLSGRQDLAYFELKKAINSGYDNYFLILEDPDLETFRKTIFWDEFKDDYNSNLNKKSGANIDFKKREELIKLYLEFTHSKDEYVEAVTKHGKDSKEAKVAQSKKDNDFDLVLHQLESFLLRNGWAKYSEVGKDIAFTNYVIFSEASIDFQKKYFPLLSEAVDQGEANPSFEAVVIDRILVSNAQKQKYGTQVYYTSDGKFALYPIKKYATVDIRRASVGLPPMSEFLEAYNIQYFPTDGLE